MEYLDSPAQAQLVERLLRGTIKGRYEWRQIGDSEYDFILSADRFGFVVRSSDRDDFAPHELDIFALQGEKPRKLQVIATDSQNPDISEYLAEIYAAVKRRVLRLDHMVDDLFGALDELDASGETK